MFKLRLPTRLKIFGLKIFVSLTLIAGLLVSNAVLAIQCKLTGPKSGWAKLQLDLTSQEHSIGYASVNTVSTIVKIPGAGEERKIEVTPGNSASMHWNFPISKLSTELKGNFNGHLAYKNSTYSTHGGYFTIAVDKENNMIVTAHLDNPYSRCFLLYGGSFLLCINSVMTPVCSSDGSGVTLKSEVHVWSHQE